MEKSFFEMIENMLENYNETKVEITNLKLDLEYLENNYNGVGSVAYKELTGKTYKLTNTVENEVIQRQKDIDRLKHKIWLKEIQIKKIDNIVEGTILTKEEILIIRERYFNKKSNKYMATLLKVSEQTSSNYKNKLIEKLIPLLNLYV